MDENYFLFRDAVEKLIQRPCSQTEMDFLGEHPEETVSLCLEKMASLGMSWVETPLRFHLRHRGKFVRGMTLFHAINQVKE